jgi:YD repeat-containing protein
LNRLKQVIHAETDTQVKTQTSYSYDDTARTITATADLNSFNDNALKTMSFFDGLGRAVETRAYEDGTNYIASQTQYDAMGRPFKSSNPFRPLSETAVWTTQAFDALGRVTSITTPDTAVVTTSYSGMSVTVTDQAGKQRTSVSDALGRLVQVNEAPNDSFLNYVTQYAYDTLDNLTTVTQGSQTRTFVYDSLKRLTSASNPESGTISYQYDNNGNLLVKTDARNVSAHYEYDRLNRLTRRWYNRSNLVTDTTHNNPGLPPEVGASNETKFFYDAQALLAGAPSFTRGSSLGRLVAQTYGAGSNGDYFAYDALGRVTLKIQQTGSVAYEVDAVYNRASLVTSMTYPSHHTITNTFDAAGRLTTFSGTLGDGVNRTYASEIIYSPFGGLAKEKFGTAAPTPVYNKQFYNVRGQLAEIRVSTSYTGPTDYDANRGAIVNNYSSQCTGICAGQSMPDNNGNLLKQEIHIPNQTMRWQQYEYDSVNRLKSAREVLNGGAEQWKQQFVYDRWGNRTIDTAVTYGVGINNKAFAVNTVKNQLIVPGGQSGVMEYDAAGNLKNDTYTGAGTRTYDAENKITSAKGNNSQDQLYAYDGSGQRIKRTINNVETWQVYGLGGELLAEYAANGAFANPQKEYGYRNGQLLITATPPQTTRKNFALRANGGSASASSEISAGCSIWPARGAIDGDRKGAYWGANGGWADSSAGSFANDWFQVDFDSTRTIDELDIFTLQDNPDNPSEPTETMTFSTYGLTAYSVSYWNGSAWVSIPEASVVGNNKVWRKFTFAPITTTKIRVLPTGGGG